jgi:cytochrome c2
MRDAKALLLTVVIGALLSTASVAFGEADITYFRADSPDFIASAKFGKQMFNTYQCAKCHAVREDQELTDAIVAPNLILAKDRLRPEWMIAWLIDPQTLQPGTKMPNFFTFNEDDDYNPIYTDADAHVQYKTIVALRDYMMILGTPAEAALGE